MRSEKLVYRFEPIIRNKQEKKKRTLMDIQDQFKLLASVAPCIFSVFPDDIAFPRATSILTGNRRVKHGPDAPLRSARSLRWYSGARTRADRDAFGPFSRVTVSATFTLFPAAVGAPNIRLFRAFLDDLDVTCSPLTCSLSSSSSSLSLKIFRCRRGWNARVNRASNVRT